MHFINVEDFDQWRGAARGLLANRVSPADVTWQSDHQQLGLFSEPNACANASVHSVSVPRSFVDLARQVACHRDPVRWSLLYRILWRLTNEQPELMNLVTDDDIHRLLQMAKAVTRDVHKMKAFVRFRKVADQPETFVAWHRPDHRIVKLAAPFFARRFKGVHWTIFTPDESARWDQCELQYGPGVPASEVEDRDDLEELWKTYYASIFNPARVKIAMMKREMPTRHWPTLPETRLIPELLQQASSRVEKMIETQEGFSKTAAHFLPAELSLPTLAVAAGSCTACDLCRAATQVVFGEGPANAQIVLVGEQPGDQEDLTGRPFVGPAGQLLDHCLEAAGVDRTQVYVTNTVKHFKFTQRGKHRLHKKPDSREIFACRPWLEAELSVVQPAVVVCLGATPAQALLGRDFRITQSRGQWRVTDWCSRTLASWHPAAILRMPTEARRLQMQQQLIDDLALAVSQASQSA